MTAPITPDERMAYCPVHGDLLAGERSWRCANAAPGHERLAPPPVWDEDTVRADMIDAVAQTVWNTLRVPGYKALDVACAVVREHLPVRPDREDVARALWRQTVRDNAMHDESVVPWDEIPTETREWWCVYADAVLALWPGESRATVQAEALRDAADTIERYAQRTDVRLTEHAIAESGGPQVLREYADRLRPRGADRG